MNFAVGDAVQLKGGSPVMTVTDRGETSAGVDTAWTVWFDGSKEMTGHYPVAALKKFEMPVYEGGNF